MALIDPTQTVHEVIEAHPELRPVFEDLGLNHCCGAHLSLTEAAASAGVPLDNVLASLGKRLAAPATVAS